MTARIDAAWLSDRDRRLFDCFGHRMDVAGLVRWSNPDIARLRDGNHAAVAPDEALIPDQLLQLFDAQRADGARRRCVDIYGEVGDADNLCEEMGLARETDARLFLVTIDREGAARPRPDDGAGRNSPRVEPIAARDWVASVTAARQGEVAPWEREVLMTEAVIPEARFYGIRIGDTPVTCVARYDWGDGSQITSLFTDPDFRKTGFGRACLSRAVFESPSPIVYGTIASDNVDMLAVNSRLGGEVHVRDVRRRYVARW